MALDAQDTPFPAQVAAESAKPLTRIILEHEPVPFGGVRRATFTDAHEAAATLITLAGKDAQAEPGRPYAQGSGHLVTVLSDRGEWTAADLLALHRAAALAEAA